MAENGERTCKSVESAEENPYASLTINEAIKLWTDALPEIPSQLHERMLELVSVGQSRATESNPKRTWRRADANARTQRSRRE